MTLLEKYSKRIQVAESLYGKANGGAKLSATRKVALAACLENVNKRLTESFENSVGTQRSDIGAYKKFVLALTNVALPSLISFDLVLVKPINGMTDYVAYINYTAGTSKGTVGQGDVFNGTFGMPQENNSNAEYTSANVTTTFTGDGSSTNSVNLAWTKVVAGTVEIAVDKSGTVTSFVDDGAGKLYKLTTTDGLTRVVTTNKNGELVAQVTLPSGATDVGTVDYETGAVALTSTYFDGSATVKYAYNNVYIPQNDLPLLNFKVEAIPIICKARRIAIYFSQIAQFQAQSEYGIDMQAELAKQAAGQLQFEIDTECINLLSSMAEQNTSASEKALMAWDKTIPVGVSIAEYYESFAEKIGYASMIIYNRTKKFAANWIVIAADVLPIIQFLKGYQALPMQNICGAYQAGVYNGIKVFVSPTLASGDYVVGVLGNDGQTAAAVYAPFMPIVPTSLTGFADGGQTQGLMNVA